MSVRACNSILTEFVSTRTGNVIVITIFVRLETLTKKAFILSFQLGDFSFSTYGEQLDCVLLELI